MSSSMMELEAFSSFIINQSDVSIPNVRSVYIVSSDDPRCSRTRKRKSFLKKYRNLRIIESNVESLYTTCILTSWNGVASIGYVARKCMNGRAEHFHFPPQSTMFTTPFCCMLGWSSTTESTYHKHRAVDLTFSTMSR